MKIKQWPSSKFTRNQLQYLKILELDDDFFGWLIGNIRVEIGLPRDGVNIEITSDNKLRVVNEEERAIFNTVDFNELMTRARFVLIVLDLPISWVPTISSIILMNFAMSVNDIEPVEILSNRNLLSNPFRSKTKDTNLTIPNFTIVVRDGFGGSYNNLINYIESNYKEVIEKKLTTLPSEPGYSSIKNLDVRIRIMELKKECLTWKQIANSIEMEFGDDLSFRPNEEVIRTYYRRFKDDVLSKLVKSNLVKKHIESGTV